MNIFKRNILMNQASDGGGAPGGAPAGDGGATPPGGGAGAAAQPPVGHGIAWLPADVDAEMVGHVQNKAWQSPVDAIKGHRELEKLLGADRAGRTITVPTDPAAPEWGALYDKLGRPTSPDGYKLSEVQGADPAFSKAAAEQFHKLGISASQAKGLMEWYQATGAGMTEAQQAAEQAALEAEHQALQKDWGTGPDADARRELARRACLNLGLDEQAVNAMEKVAGFSKVMKAFAKVGDLMREHGAEGLGEIGSFGTTPEGAKAKRTQLMADAGWRTKAMVPNSAEWAELQRLDRIISSTL